MRFKHLATLVALAAAVPATSQAQIGGLVKKAANAATNKAEQKVVRNANLKPSNAFGPELTAETLDAVLRGLAAADAKLDEADRHRAAGMKINDQLSKSVEAHDKDRDRYDDLRIKVQACHSNEHAKRQEALEAELEKKRTDPAAQARMMQIAAEVGPKIAAAQAKGDTAEFRRLSMQMFAAQGIDPAADSAAVIKTCGAVPAKPKWLVEQDSLRAAGARSDSQTREAESAAGAAGSAASGMPKTAYMQARERVLHWYLEDRGNSPIQHFGGDERKLMEGKRDAIKKLSRALSAGA